jgi:hypothetical protein
MTWEGVFNAPSGLSRDGTMLDGLSVSEAEVHDAARTRSAASTGATHRPMVGTITEPPGVVGSSLSQHTIKG